jgi:hypothetical protein
MMRAVALTILVRIGAGIRHRNHSRVTESAISMVRNPSLLAKVQKPSLPLYSRVGPLWSAKEGLNHSLTPSERQQFAGRDRQRCDHLVGDVGGGGDARRP